VTRIKALKCRECGKEYPAIKIYYCQECFAPLEVIYNYDKIEINPKELYKRPKTLWRYFELFPINDKKKIVDLGAGFTNLHKCNELSKKIGIRDLYVKNDTTNPTYSFKDRPASIAVTKALEFGSDGVGCVSTGNLAAATAAHAAKAGLRCSIFIPNNIEANKIIQSSIYGARLVSINGTYDDANRLALQASEIYDWPIVNVNLRPYYAEGSKSLAYETCEQLDWDVPDHVVVPTASGALLCAIDRGFNDFKKLDFIENKNVKISAAQPKGCSPIVQSYKDGRNEITPVEYPDTVAKSLAIGDPGDGIYALKTIDETKGFAESATDAEIIDAIKLLAKTEGIFSEPAGSVTIAVLKKMVEQGDISPDEKVVCYVTGSGFKSIEAIKGLTPELIQIDREIETLTSIIS
jgi:threonine synthase